MFLWYLKRNPKATDRECGGHVAMHRIIHMPAQILLHGVCHAFKAFVGYSKAPIAQQTIPLLDTLQPLIRAQKPATPEEAGMLQIRTNPMSHNHPLWQPRHHKYMSPDFRSVVVMLMTLHSFARNEIIPDDCVTKRSPSGEYNSYLRKRPAWPTSMADFTQFHYRVLGWLSVEIFFLIIDALYVEWLADFKEREDSK